MLLLFFLRRGGSKKVSKKGALQLEEILHPSSLKAGHEAFLLGPRIHD
jgi:hypothetical protein